MRITRRTGRGTYTTMGASTYVFGGALAALAVLGLLWGLVSRLLSGRSVPPAGVFFLIVLVAMGIGQYIHWRNGADARELANLLAEEQAERDAADLARLRARRQAG